MSGYSSWTGGAFFTSKKRLEKERYVVLSKGHIQLDSSMIGSPLQDRLVGRLSTNEEILELVTKDLKPRSKEMFMKLQEHGGSLKKAELGRVLKYTTTSAGAFCTHSKLLVDRGFINYDRSTKVYSIPEDISALFTLKTTKRHQDEEDSEDQKNKRVKTH